MINEIKQLLSSTDLEDVKKGIEFIRKENINLEAELYEDIYRHIYQNYTRIKRVDSIPIEDKIRSLNLHKTCTIHLEDFNLDIRAITKLHHLKTLKVFFSKFGIQLSYSFVKAIFELGFPKELIILDYPLKYLDDSLNQFTTLESLDISYSKIEKLPLNISHLKNLRKLILKGSAIPKDEVNRIKSILPKCEIEE